MIRLHLSSGCKMYKLILLDLDGTLLHSDKMISDYTVEALNRCKAAGSMIGICTARGLSNALPFVSQIKPELIISSGGALVTYRGNIVYTSMFSEEDTNALIRKAQALTDNKCEITVDTLEHYYWNYKVEPREMDASWGVTIYTDYADFHEKALKICVELPDIDLAEQIANSIPECDAARFSDGDWYKFTPKSATKEKAIEKILSILSITREDIIAFGDDYTDIGMLQMCGRGVAMGNAIDAVKQIADDIADSNDHDGVAKYLENIFICCP